MSDQALTIGQLFALFLSIFQGVNVWGVVIAILFGAIWFACFKPSLIAKPWLWAVLVGGGMVGAVALVFVQMPLQEWLGNSMLAMYGGEQLTSTMIISGIPSLVVSGLVQEGAKIVPVVLYFWRKDWKIEPKFGLIIGAAAGAGFGILEAQWLLSSIINQGWNLDFTITYGWFLGISPLWERFFTVAFHIGATALVGYGLAKGLGWHYYAAASVLHIILNYSVILMGAKVFPIAGVEVYIAVWAAAVITWALILRWQTSAEKK